MTRTIGFIDGFNLYHALTEADHLGNRRYVGYRWLDYRKLVECYLRVGDILSEVYYFTAYASWNTPSGIEKKQKHQSFVIVQRECGVTVVLGRFRPTWKKCMATCKQRYQTYEEKRTDVNIAITMLKLAMLGQYEKAILISGDSDLTPAIKAVRETRPKIKITTVVPIGRTGKALINASDSDLNMKESHLRKSLLPREVALKNGRVITCPTGWMV